MIFFIFSLSLSLIVPAKYAYLYLPDFSHHHLSIVYTLLIESIPNFTHFSPFSLPFAYI